MNPATATVRHADGGPAVIVLHGDVTAASEQVLTDAHTQTVQVAARDVVLDFGNLQYMNSGGIGMLVTLLVRTQRHGQRLAAIGLSDHYRNIFSLTRLDEAITLYDDEDAAVAALAEASTR
jgi:anti-sigma B factor antagonist